MLAIIFVLVALMSTVIVIWELVAPHSIIIKYMDKDVSIVIMVNVLCCSKLYRFFSDLSDQTLTHLNYKLTYKRYKH